MNQYFDNIICLNLPNRTDRKAQAKKEFENNGLHVDFYPGVKGGNAGFCRAMYNIFQDYTGSLFVFEDDVQFINPVDNRVFDELPDDWDLIYLGANLREPVKKYSDHLMILKNAWTTHSVGYSEKMVDHIKREWNGKYNPPYVFDEWLRQFIQPNFKCYIANPMICTQRNSYSDIQKRDVNYNIIEGNYKKFARA